ncbi:deoxyribonuclease-2-beta-like [Perca fluviatilis]|uniref:deoxyribonuclease-2-beta-like n=1 Tax=Perca fluviatilis TaxID=8168 RepID=UPI0019651A8E|nr:deoxyribonuclease-2-beta-like [Perca fluviatilis]
MWRIFLMVSLLCWSADGQVTCRDHNNGEVDWYIMYKAPKLNNIGTTGLEYLYTDSTGKTETSKSHNKLIDDPNGVLANTLRPIFKPTTSMPKDFGFITYSDQPPGKTVPQKFGHSKGLVMMEKVKTGVWLLHSTPQFPFTRDNNFWPSSGAAKAQTFICVTFKYNEFKKIGEHLLDIAAFPFDHQIPADFHKELIDVTEKKNPPGEGMQDLRSAAGGVFRSFAKHNIENSIKDTDPKRFEGDLYLTIAKEYDTGVKVQTWGCQHKREYSYCGQRNVFNIPSVKVDLGNGEVKWKASNDHSKWCVAEGNNDLICIADVNRAITQYKRPGGGLCFNNKEASNLFKGLIDDTDPCSRKRPHDPDCDPDDDL